MKRETVRSLFPLLVARSGWRSSLERYYSVNMPDYSFFSPCCVNLQDIRSSFVLLHDSNALWFPDPPFLIFLCIAPFAGKIGMYVFSEADRQVSTSKANPANPAEWRGKGRGKVGARTFAAIVLAYSSSIRNLSANPAEWRGKGRGKVGARTFFAAIFLAYSSFLHNLSARGSWDGCTGREGIKISRSQQDNS